jgi:hypothetical protein
MAAITSANVTPSRTWETMGADGCVKEKTSDLAIVLSAQGGTAGDIPASALGFAKIYSAFGLAFDDATNVRGAWVGVAVNGSEIFPIDAVVSTDANRTLRANLTGTLYVRVTGSSKL